MAAKRRKHSPEFKSRVALAALKGDRTLAQLASEFEVSAVQISQWKKQLTDSIPELFERKKKSTVDVDTLTAPLYQEIGRLKMQVDWLKKKQDLTLDQKRECIDPNHPCFLHNKKGQEGRLIVQENVRTPGPNPRLIFLLHRAGSVMGKIPDKNWEFGIKSLVSAMEFMLEPLNDTEDEQED